MTEEAVYPVPEAPLPDLQGLFPSLSQDAELAPVTDVPLPVSGTSSSVHSGPPVQLPPQEGPLASDTASDASEANFGALMAQEDPIQEPEQRVQLDLELTLQGHPKFLGGSAEWHAMNSGLVLSRNRSVSPPWKRMRLPRLNSASLFQQPLLGRFDHAVLAPEVVVPSVPWSWIPKSTYEARRLMAARFAMTEDQLKLAALRKVRSIVLMFPEDTELGKSLVGAAGTFIEENALMTTLEDAFRGKAEGTLRKRATDFSKFARWIVARKGRPLAPSELEVYEYLCYLRSSKASATSGESFLKSYKFFAHLTGGSPPRIAPRSEGIARSLAVTKRPLWTAPELSVVAVTALERFCHDASDPVRVSVRGFNLFCAYSSSRWSDAARASRIKLDHSASGVTLLEAETMHYKTRAKDRKNKVLPLIALGNGLTQPAWAISWMKTRDHLGMENLSCLMPGVSASNNFLPRPMSAAEGTMWLRELLHMQGVNEDLERYSSHSLKATCLSWTAKSCSVSYEERLTQGHHVSPKHGMALLYSRDALTEILIKVARVVKAIAGRSFQPDLPRAERVAAALADDPAKYKHLPETEPEDVVFQEPELENMSEAGSDLSDHAELTGPDSVIVQQELKPRVERPLKGPAWIHILSGVSHEEASQGLLKCGRKITVNMRVMADFEPHNMVCQQCAAGP